MKLRHMAFAVPIFLGVAVVNGYMTRAGSDDLRGKMLVDARQRTYDLHVPTNYDGTKDAPLLIALHGRLGTGSDQQRRGHLDRLSDEFGFLVVYPDGLQRSWVDGRGATPSDKSDVDDVKFISALIDTLESKYKVDRSRIYATGMSNGGFMTGRLACDLSDRIAAVAIVGASISENVAADCHPAKPVSALIIQGSEDPLVPFGGALDDQGVALPHDAAVQKFVQVNHCAGEPKKDHIPGNTGDRTSLDVTTYVGCAGGSEVQSYVVHGAGHAWPGGVPYLPATFVGRTTRNLDGSKVIWEFLSGHSR
ncbi:MAG: PHB depolymerase family esterase [Candidatus Acidiferrum sp.]